MANSTDFPGNQQPNEEWTNFPKDLSSLPYHPYQATFDSTCEIIPISEESFLIRIVPASVLPGQSIVEQNVNYDPVLNEYMLPSNTKYQIDLNYPPLGDAELSSCFDHSQNLNSYSQPSSQSFPAFGMSTETSIPDVTNESVELSGVETQLRCRVPGCTQEREFSTESALRKHQDKHTKPFACVVPGCKQPRFGDKGGLDRHNREVHGSKTYCCAIPTCKRHRRGFPRKYNLFEHQKRCHPGQSLNPALSLAQTSPNRASFDHEGAEEIQYKDREASSPEVTATWDMARASGRRLQEKLESLYELRVEIDNDIEALKRAEDILKAPSP